MAGESPTLSRILPSGEIEAIWQHRNQHLSNSHLHHVQWFTGVSILIFPAYSERLVALSWMAAVVTTL